MDTLDAFLARAEALMARLEPLLPAAIPAIDWSASAFRWRRIGLSGHLEAIHQPHTVKLAELHGIDAQKQTLIRNTGQFIAGRPANNVLLTGARGTGKSSLIKALLAEYADQGLRVIEVEKAHLPDLDQIIAHIAPRPERFILFCDDLSFEEGEDSYKALKSALDGGLLHRAANLLVYATSNRRHLMPEKASENRESRVKDGEIHPGETTEEKVSLSDRFGLWLSFYPFDQQAYLAAAAGWLAHFGLPYDADAEYEALQWSRVRGSHSGRVAWQFACDFAGRQPG